MTATTVKSKLIYKEIRHCFIIGIDMVLNLELHDVDLNAAMPSIRIVIHPKGTLPLPYDDGLSLLGGVAASIRVVQVGGYSAFINSILFATEMSI